MREDPTVGTHGHLGAHVTDDNIVELPNLVTGRLADLLAAAAGPAQGHELRGESEARADFVAASGTWPTLRRRSRRTPAALVVTTMATMMVATTGLAAATQLPGPAGPAVQSLLGSVGVTITSPPPAPPPAGSTSGAGTAGTGVHDPGGTHHVAATGLGCTTAGTTTGATPGGIRTASCTISVAHQPAPTTPTTAPATSSWSLARSHGSLGGTHQGGRAGGGSGGTTLGGGTSRGGNQGGGCPTTTTTTTVGTTTTTVPSAAAGGCGHSGGHHHGGTGGTGSTTTTTTP